MNLQGRIAVVTGGSGGLGRVIVRSLIAEGATVHTFDRSGARAAEALSAAGERVVIHEVDVLDELQLARAYDAVVATHGRVEVLVNTVGKSLPPKPLGEWQAMMSLNLTSVFLSCREFLRRCNRSYARIFNISAMVGLDPVPFKIPYAVSKAGVALLTELLARELKGTGITVHAFAPSILVTDANVASMTKEDTSPWVSPESLARMVVFLCGDSAGEISGTTIRAYGGV
jgi:NAD(P)-dependent dehydrogenase (short-subunit alcohol dehydrogenase family)